VDEEVDSAPARLARGRLAGSVDLRNVSIRLKKNCYSQKRLKKMYVEILEHMKIRCESGGRCNKGRPIKNADKSWIEKEEL
jgi:hypothetical protein